MKKITESLTDKLNAYNLLPEDTVIAERCEELTELINELIQEVESLKKKMRRL